MVECREDVVREVFSEGDSVSSLVEKLVSKGYSRVQAISMVYNCLKIGVLSERVFYKNFLSYALRSDSRLWSISVLTIASVLLALLATKPPLLYARYVLGSLYVLFLPGYALIEFLYPRGNELSPLERVALSIGLSLAIVPLIGLLLNYTPWGIRLKPILVSTSTLTIALALASSYRRYAIMRLIGS